MAASARITPKWPTLPAELFFGQALLWPLIQLGGCKDQPLAAASQHRLGLKKLLVRSDGELAPITHAVSTDGTHGTRSHSAMVTKSCINSSILNTSHELLPQLVCSPAKGCVPPDMSF